MTEQALVPVAQDMSLQDTITLGNILAKSGYFSDAKQEAQAVVKILAGREMGFGPVASMTGIHIIKGNPSPSANLMASAVKANPRYDYKVLVMDDTKCALEFYEHGKSVGTSRFDKVDAQKAGTQNMQKFPRNMLFARAMSNGVKWYCPDVFNGVAAYVPEELGAPVDAEGEIIDVTPTPPGDNGGGVTWTEPVVEAGEDDTEPVEITVEISNAKELFVAVSNATDGRYMSEVHMRNAIRMELDDAKWNWLAPDDAQGWQVAYDAAVHHAKETA